MGYKTDNLKELSSDNTDVPLKKAKRQTLASRLREKKKARAIKAMKMHSMFSTILFIILVTAFLTIIISSGFYYFFFKFGGAR